MFWPAGRGCGRRSVDPLPARWRCSFASNRRRARRRCALSSTRKLKEIHTATHPAKARQPRSYAATLSPADSTAPTADELLNTLAAEAREEDSDT